MRLKTLPRQRLRLKPCLVAVGIALLLKTASLGAQGQEPLLRSDLFRLLTSDALSKTEIAALVSRNCLAFEPTTREREQLRSLGADDAIMAAIDECGRRRSVLQVAPTATRVTAAAGGLASLVVRVTRAGRPAAGVELTLGGSGALAGAQGTNARAVSNQNGAASFQFPAGTVAGTHRFTVAATSGETLEGTTSITLVVGAAEAVRADVRPQLVELTPMTPGGVELTVVLRDRHGNFVAGEEVRLQPSSPDMGLDEASGTTNAEGSVVFIVDANTVRANGQLTIIVGTAPLASVPVSVAPGIVSVRQTRFVSGTDQSGVVATTLSQPLVLEVRDERGRRTRGRQVQFSAANATVTPLVATTDSLGRAGVTVRLGVDASRPATIAASVEGMRVEAAIRVAPGAASDLTVTRDGQPVGETLVLDGNAPVTLRVDGVDPFGNRASVTDLRASIENESVLGLMDVATDSLGARVVIRPVSDGSTPMTFEVGGLSKKLLARLRLSRLPYFTGYTHLYGTGAILAPNAYIAPGRWDVLIVVGAAFPKLGGSRPADEGASAIVSWRGRAEFGITAFSSSEFGTPVRVQILPPRRSGLALAVGALNLLPLSDSIGRHGLLGAGGPYNSYIERASPYLVASLARHEPASPIGYLVSLGWGAGMFLEDNSAYSSSGRTSGIFGAVEVEAEASPGVLFRLTLEHDSWDTNAGVTLLWRGIGVTLGVLGLDEGSADQTSNALNQTRLFLRIGASLRQSREWLGR